MKLQHFKPTFEAPYYYACHFPILHDKLLSMGSLSFLSLIANDQLYSIPACCIDSERALVTLDWYAPLLNRDQQLFSYKRRAYNNFEDGLQGMKDCIECEEFFIASGSTYFLPYSKDYNNSKFIRGHTDQKSDKYITDHYLAVYGVTESHVLIHDPVPHKYMGPIEVKEFADFWRGNKSIAELSFAKGFEKLASYGTLDVTLKETITSDNMKECFITILKIVSNEFIKGTVISKKEKTYYFGMAVSTLLKSNINQAITESAEILQMYSKCLFDMRWSRYFFNDLLKDMYKILGNDFLDEYQEIINKWELVSGFFQKNALKSGFNMSHLHTFNHLLSQVIDKEKEFHEKVLVAI
nr:hypothetical protein [Evansella caseinilytica]